MPWKNGAGTTVEIAVVPEHAGIDDFEWRVSRASVVADGDFSHFAGIDRSLALLQGSGLRLRQPGAITQVDVKNNIAIFPGDVAVHATLIDGAISDFNVMSRRTSCKHQLSHWTNAAPQTLPDHTVLLYCAQGRGRLVGGDAELLMSEDESVLFSLPDQVHTITLHADTGSRFYCVQIYR